MDTKLLTRLLGGSSFLAWLAVAGLCLGAAGGAYWWVDNHGYQRATLEWSVKYTQREVDLERRRLAELDRQATANDIAKAAEAARIAQLRNEAAQMERRLQDLAKEATSDPDAERLGINADSVARINSVGR